MGQSVWMEYSIPQICGNGLHFTVDGFRVIYCCILTFMWVMTALFSKEYFYKHHHVMRYHIFHWLTYVATIGIFLSADLFTTFIFFEIMSFTSYVWVVQEEKDSAIKAANTYLTVAIIGGLTMLMGLFLLQNTAGTLVISELSQAVADAGTSGRLVAAGICIFIGFAAKAGVYPLHIWLPQAHPVAPAPASALLSGALTKTGVFGMLLVSIHIFAGNQIFAAVILSLAVVTMVLGAILAFCSTHVKRILACSSMSQIGFILTGIAMMNFLGEHNTIAARGVFLHMMNHSLIKLVLFIFAGIMMMNTHKGTINELRGYGRKKKALHFGFLMGALGIGGIPLWNGYLSKTLLHESIVEYYHMTHLFSIQLVEWAFLLAGGITVAYMMKLYFAIFWERNEDESLQEKYNDASKSYMSPLTCFVFLGSATILPIIGMCVSLITDPILDLGESFLGAHGLEEGISYFAWGNLQGGLISIGIGCILYVLLVRGGKVRKQAITYKDLWPKWFDLEVLLYRPILLYTLPFIGGVIARLADSLIDGIVILLRKTVYRDRPLPHELEEGNLFTHIVGMALDEIVHIYEVLFHKKKEHLVSYEHKLAVLREEHMESNMMIGRSLSFGLFMFCLGLSLTLIYVIFL